MSEIPSNEAIGFTPTAFRRWLGAVDIASAALPFIMWTAVGLAVFYAFTIAYGAISGYGLPTTAIFSVVPHGEAIGRGEKYLPRLLLVIAIAGAMVDWATAVGCELPRLARNEAAAARIFFRWGFLILCMTWLLALSASGWSGRISALDNHQYSSLAGLFPHSDAGGHYLAPMEQILTGHWSSFASRRPFAAATRHLTETVAGFSYVWTLIFQAVLLAGALFAAVRSVIIWRGIWAGFAFCAFGYLIIRPFIATTLTEPLGLAWGLLSVMFFIEAMRLHSARYAFLGLIALTFAEVIRMGSMFTVPALVLWIAIVFGENLRARAKLFAIGCGAVVSAFLAQTLCAYLYGNPASITGGNFAYVLCGLASGGDWTTCPKVYAQEFSRLTTERDQAAFLYTQAIHAILRHPSGVAFGIIRNIRSFVSETPYFITTGYNGPIQTIPRFGLLLLVPGLIFTLSLNRARGELLFWSLILVSMVASAAIIFQDDGSRTMTVTWPFVALLFSFGCTSPATSGLERNFEPLLTVRKGLVLILAVVVAVIVTPAATRLWPGREVRSLSNAAAAATDREAVLFGRTLTGFLVLPDDVSLPKQTPAVHVSEFEEMIRNIGMERDFGSFLDVAMKKVPFAFVTGARVSHPENQSEQVYLAPVDILTGGTAEAWRVTFGDALHNFFIHDVVQVQPAH